MATGALPARPAGKQLDALPLRQPSWLERTVGPDWYRLLAGLFTNPLSIAGMIIIGLFFLVGLLAPVLAPPITRDPYQIPRDGFSSTPRPPGSEWRTRPPQTVPAWYRLVTGRDEWVHLFGTASGQWDIYYGIIWGTRTALKTGVLITAATLAVGILVGSLAAFYGGLLDDLLMRVTEIFMAFPFLLAALTLSTILASYGRSIWPPTIALIAFGWMTYARVVRGDILVVRERDYVLAARVIGAKDARILLRHILPNAIFPTLVLASLDVGTYVLSFAALSFLGVGTEVGYADWGQIVAFARPWILNLNTHWYIIVFPGVVLILFGLGWNLVGDALRDILDPKLRGVRG